MKQQRQDLGKLQVKVLPQVLLGQNVFHLFHNPVVRGLVDLLQLKLGLFDDLENCQEVAHLEFAACVGRQLEQHSAPRLPPLKLLQPLQ